MFRLSISEDIDLVLLYNGMAKQCFDLIDRNRKYLGKWMPWVSLTKSPQDTLVFIKKSLHDYADGSSLLCAISYQSTIVGLIGFNIIDYTLKKVEMGYWIDEDFQGNGIITESATFLIRYAFEVLNMEKVQINVATDNLKSQAVCLRLGAVLEGTLRNCERIEDRILSHNIYALYNPTLAV